MNSLRKALVYAGWVFGLSCVARQVPNFLQGFYFGHAVRPSFLLLIIGFQFVGGQGGECGLLLLGRGSGGVFGGGLLRGGGGRGRGSRFLLLAAGGQAQAERQSDGPAEGRGGFVQ